MLTGDPLLDAVTAAMTALHERYFHRVPATVSTSLIDDELLACVMGGVYTDVEKTLIELDYGDLVHETRSIFKRAMEHTFIAEIQRATGRRVTSFISNGHVGPDLQVELFLLAPVEAEAPIEV